MPTMQEQQEFMRLREGEGHGVVPEDQRNRGYEKLSYGPGEGGFKLPDPDRPQGDMQAFLAAVKAGADPQKLATELTADTSTRPRRGQRS